MRSVKIQVSMSHLLVNTDSSQTNVMNSQVPAVFCPVEQTRAAWLRAAEPRHSSDPEDAPEQCF